MKLYQLSQRADPLPSIEIRLRENELTLQAGTTLQGVIIYRIPEAIVQGIIMDAHLSHGKIVDDYD